MPSLCELKSPWGVARVAKRPCFTVPKAHAF
jgi:hypothetical protein